jgi:hypothetical protein
VDDTRAEGLAEIQREVGHSHPVGEGPRAGHGLRRAAALGAVGAGVRPELERDAHDLVARVQGEARRHGAVHAAAHGHDRAPAGRRDGCAAVAHSRTQGAVASVGGKLGGVVPSRGESAELGGQVLRSQSGRLEQLGPVDQLHDRAAGRLGRGAPARRETRLRDARPVHAHGHSDQVPAGGTARSSDVLGAGNTPAPPRGQQMLLEERSVLGSHRLLLASVHGGAALVRRLESSPSLPLPPGS